MRKKLFAILVFLLVTSTAYAQLSGIGDWAQKGRAGYDIRVYGAIPDNGVDDRAAFALADTAAGGTKNIIVPAGVYNINSNLTISSPITFLPGAQINVANTKTVTINGKLDANSYNIFGGSGSVVFPAKYDVEINVVWFATGGTGAVGTPFTGWEVGVNALPQDTMIRFPAGYYTQSAIIITKIGWHVKGDGFNTIITSSFNTDAFQSTNTINSSTAVHLIIQDLNIVNTSVSNIGAGIDEVGGSFISIKHVKINGFKYGIIFDQTELGDIEFCDIESPLLACIWLCSGPDHTALAAIDFTNRISISHNQFNVSGAAIGIIDDGGVTHHIVENNFNGGLNHLIIAGAKNLLVENNEFEGSSSNSILVRNYSYNTSYSTEYCGQLFLMSNLIQSIYAPCIAVTTLTPGLNSVRSLFIKGNYLECPTHVVTGGDLVYHAYYEGNEKTGGAVEPFDINPDYYSENGNFPILFSGGDAQTELRLSNTATNGDPLLSWLIPGTTQWSMGIDDSDGDALKIASTGVLDSSLLTITTDGKFSAGLSAPQQVFDINKDQNASTMLLVRNNNNTSGANSILRLQGTGASSGYQAVDFLQSGVQQWLMGQDTADGSKFKIAASGAFGTGGWFTITPLGKVGYGFHTPLSKVSINGGCHVGGDSDPGDNNLAVDGVIQMVGGSPAVGKVAVCDASGNMTWGTVPGGGTPTNSIGAFADSDTSPSIVGNTGFNTSAAGATIVALDGGVDGDERTIMFINSLTTINDVDGTIELDGDLPFTGTVDDTLTVIYNGTKWLEKGRKVN